MEKEKLIQEGYTFVRPGLWRKKEGNITVEEFDVREIMKARRKELRMTMQQLADAAGTTKATISRLESGKIDKFDSDKLAKIAQALKCSPLYLLAQCDTPYPEDAEDDFANRLYTSYMDADEKTKSIVRQLLDL